MLCRSKYVFLKSEEDKSKMLNYDEITEIANYHMGYRVDPNTHDVTFLYQLTKGACSNSFGIQVAKLAGLPQKVLEIAHIQSEHFKKKLKQFEVQDDQI